MMQALDQTFPAEIKIAICILLAICFFVVYLWDPEQTPRTRAPKQRNAKLDSMDVEPNEYSPDEKSFHPEGHTQAFTEGEATLRNLDEYVRSLKEHQINDPDKT